MAQFFTDFSEYTDGVQPTGWTEQISASTGTGVVTATGSPTTGVKMLRIVKTASSYHTMSWDDVGTPSGDVEVLVRTWRPNLASAANQAEHVVLHGAGTTTLTGYVTISTRGTSSASLLRFATGTGNSLDSDSAVEGTAAWRWTRLQRTGTTIRARWWADGGAEPGTWLLTATDATLSSGWVGIGIWTFSSNFNLWVSQFSVGTAGDPAPLTAPAPAGADTTGFFF